MRGKRLLAILCISVITLSACGQQTLNLTEEEEQKIINYSSNVLTSHNANYNSSLKKMSDRQLAEVLKKEMEESQKKQERAETKVENPEPDNTKEDQSGSSGGSSAESVKDSDSTASIDQLADLIGLKGFSVSYKGYEIVDSYPPEMTDSVVFSLEPASSTDMLLVLKFDVTNEGDTEADCNMLDLSPEFRFSINGEKHSFLNTLLLDDLQTLETPIGSHESAEAVLVAEISKEKSENIKPLSLYIKRSDGSKEIPLE